MRRQIEVGVALAIMLLSAWAVPAVAAGGTTSPAVRTEPATACGPIRVDAAAGSAAVWATNTGQESSVTLPVHYGSELVVAAFVGTLAVSIGDRFNDSFSEASNDTGSGQVGIYTATAQQSGEDNVSIYFPEGDGQALPFDVLDLGNSSGVAMSAAGWNYSYVGGPSGQAWISQVTRYTSDAQLLLILTGTGGNGPALVSGFSYGPTGIGAGYRWSSQLQVPISATGSQTWRVHTNGSTASVLGDLGVEIAQGCGTIPAGQSTPVSSNSHYPQVIATASSRSYLNAAQQAVYLPVTAGDWALVFADSEFTTNGATLSDSLGLKWTEVVSLPDFKGATQGGHPAYAIWWSQLRVWAAPVKANGTDAIVVTVGAQLGKVPSSYGPRDVQTALTAWDLRWWSGKILTATHYVNESGGNTPDQYGTYFNVSAAQSLLVVDGYGPQGGGAASAIGSYTPGPTNSVSATQVQFDYYYSAGTTHATGGGGFAGKSLLGYTVSNGLQYSTSLYSTAAVNQLELGYSPGPANVDTTPTGPPGDNASTVNSAGGAGGSNGTGGVLGNVTGLFVAPSGGLTWIGWAALAAVAAVPIALIVLLTRRGARRDG